MHLRTQKIAFACGLKDSNLRIEPTRGGRACWAVISACGDFRTLGSVLGQNKAGLWSHFNTTSDLPFTSVYQGRWPVLVLFFRRGEQESGWSVRLGSYPH